MKPRIGISTDLGEGGEKLSLRRDYVRAVERAGGIPLLLPIVESTESQDLLAALDGLLLTGGAMWTGRSTARLPRLTFRD